MKRSHGIGAFLGLILAVAGCGHAPDGDSPAPAAEPAKQAEAKAPLKVTAPPRAVMPVKPARPAEAPAPAGGEAKEDKCDHCDNCNGKEVNAETDKVESVAIGASPSRGPSNAPVTIVVFSDFQCPFCSRAEATIRELEAAYPGKIRFVFKNQPLPFHEHARLAAKAALAAHEQGKFWEYHDVLFNHQNSLDRASLERYAEDVGLDLRRFRAALDDPRLDRLIEADIAEARRLDVRGTPAFFINGRNLQGAQPLAAFRAKVDEALAEP
jgi:protein-disulfide isomerase